MSLISRCLACCRKQYRYVCVVMVTALAWLLWQQFDYHEEMLSWVEMTDQSLSNATIVNLNPKQLARQLILLEYALYAAIERRYGNHILLLCVQVIILSNQ